MKFRKSRFPEPEKGKEYFLTYPTRCRGIVVRKRRMRIGKDATLKEKIQNTQYFVKITSVENRTENGYLGNEYDCYISEFPTLIRYFNRV